MDNKNFVEAVQLRGRSFFRNLETYRLMSRIKLPEDKSDLSGGRSFNLAIMNVGAPACGINACLRSFVRVGLYHGCRIYTIHDAFLGLMKGDFKEMNWSDVSQWVMHGGSLIGCHKELPKNYAKICEQLAKFDIHGLVIVGGFEAYHSAVLLDEARRDFPQLCIPICVIPATISNNVPGTAFSIGADTALNEICSCIDKIKQSATGTKRRVFIIETMGGFCGYLATLSALASGADNAYIFEEKFTVDDIVSDVKVVSAKMEKGVQRYLLVRSENANVNYTTEFITRLFREESGGNFDTRINILGTKMAVRAVEWILQLCSENLKQSNDDNRKEHVFCDQPNSVSLLGVVQRSGNQEAFSRI
uniref:6-phosphofructokinase n=1 Tax=Romanomermis culicivorax TaxID=13658 RepID=A0A915IUN5_ROMCU